LETYLKTSWVLGQKGPNPINLLGKPPFLEKKGLDKTIILGSPINQIPPQGGGFIFENPLLGRFNLKRGVSPFLGGIPPLIKTLL